ncbi:MAG: VWA domain-containing protein [Alphaproteobacteria bacterium]|nr:VWA domain-containing protein [Alphaproteobacteria bacterium]
MQILTPARIVALATAITLGSITTAQAASNVLIILDASNSMWGQKDGIAKIETAKQVVGKLLGDMEASTQVGLMAYGHRIEGDCQDVETLSGIGSEPRDALTAKVNALKPKGKTPIAYSLQTSASNFDDPEANNNVVLISDGIESCDGDPCAEAKALASRGIGFKIHVVGFDVDEQTRAQLECIAENGRGQYFHASNTEAFKLAMAEVQQVAQAAPEPAEPTWTEVFRDDFTGDVLGEHWDVLNPNADAYIVEDDQLLVVSATSGTHGALDFANLFQLAEALPKGDWVATAKLNIEFATGHESVFIGVIDSQDDALYSWLYAWRGQYKEGFSLSMIKRSNGQDTSSKRAILKSANHKSRPAADSLAPRIAQPIYLRMTKTGRSYVAGVKLGDDPEAQWIETDKVTLLRAKGALAVGTNQEKDLGSESLFTVDWVKIEVPGQ